MGYKAIYAYPWDLAETGVNAAVDRFRALGLDTGVAGSYNAGKFLRPHGRSGKVYFPEDGTVYFKPDRRPLRRDQADRAFDALFGSGHGARLARLISEPRSGQPTMPCTLCATQSVRMAS